jgi:pimeloyl-ACP methyl ester carboxylesterase
MPTLHIEHDVELFYEDIGAGEPVLLLHGLGSSSAEWAAQIEALAPRYRVLAVDIRGSGRSRDLQQHATPFSIMQFANDAARLLDHLGAIRAHVVGLSLGGMITFQLAVDHPRLVGTLTIVNSVPELVPRTLKEHVTVGLRSCVARILGPAGVARLLAPRLFPKPEEAPLRQRFIEFMSRNDKQTYIATQRAMFGWSVLDRIEKIEAPVLVVHSEHDYWPVELKRAYVRRMKRAELVVIPDVGHALPIQAPERFNNVLAAFLERHQTAEPRRHTLSPTRYHS